MKASHLTFAAPSFAPCVCRTPAPRPPTHTPQAFNIDIARQAFVRLRDVSALDLVERVEAGLGGKTPRPLLAAEAAAWCGDYQEAARLMVAEGAVDKVGRAVCVEAGGWQAAGALTVCK